MQDRLQDCDPRFSYEITFPADGPRPAPRPNALLTVSDNNKIVTVFPRDAKAIALDPPTAAMTLRGTGVEKFQEFLKTGKPINFAPGELTRFASDFDFLLPAGAQPVETWRLQVSQSQLPKYCLRVTFGAGADAIVYDLVEFATMRLGQDEAELRSTTPLPFQISVVLQFTGRGTINYRAAMVGFPVTAVHRATTAIKTTTKTGVVELYDLVAEKRFFRLHTTGNAPPWLDELEELAATAVRVGEFYGKTLIWPTAVTMSDGQSLARLRGLIDGLPASVNSANMTITKVVQSSRAELEEPVGHAVFQVFLPVEEHRVFGVRIATTPVMVINECHIVNDDEYKAFVRDAPLGTTMQVRLKRSRGIIQSLPVL